MEVNTEGEQQVHLLWLSWDTPGVDPHTSFAPRWAKQHGLLSCNLPEGTLDFPESSKVSMRCLRTMNAELKNPMNR